VSQQVAEIGIGVVKVTPFASLLLRYPHGTLRDTKRFSRRLRAESVPISDTRTSGRETRRPSRRIGGGNLRDTRNWNFQRLCVGEMRSDVFVSADDSVDTDVKSVHNFSRAQIDA